MQLITVEEMDELPDDPQLAFVHLERICRTRLHQLTAEMEDYRHAASLRTEYMTVVGAAAQAYGVADLGDVSEFGEANFDRVFQRAMDAATRIAIQSKLARSESMLALTEGAKARLTKHIDQLIEELQRSDLTEKKKGILRKKANDLRESIENDKVSLTTILVNVTLIATAITQVQDAIIKMPESASAIYQLIGRDKMKELEAAPEPLPKVLPVPPKKLPSPQASSTSRKGSPFDETDDEVPF